MEEQVVGILGDGRAQMGRGRGPGLPGERLAGLGDRVQHRPGCENGGLSRALTAREGQEEADRSQKSDRPFHDPEGS